MQAGGSFWSALGFGRFGGGMAGSTGIDDILERWSAASHSANQLTAQAQLNANQHSNYAGNNPLDEQLQHDNIENEHEDTTTTSSSAAAAARAQCDAVAVSLLEELLDHDDVIQECKYMNAQLIEYLSQRGVVEKLIRYVIAKPPSLSNDSDTNNTNNNSNTPSEINNSANTSSTSPSNSSATSTPATISTTNATTNTSATSSAATTDPFVSSSSSSSSTTVDDPFASTTAAAADSSDPFASSSSSSSSSSTTTTSNSALSPDLPCAPVSISRLSSRANSNRYPYLASELFACEVVSMLDVICMDTTNNGTNTNDRAPDYLLDLLFSFLQQPAPLDPACAAYFRKVVVVLIQRKYEHLQQYIRFRAPWILDGLVNHIGLYSLMELLIMIGWDDGLGQCMTDTDWLADMGLVDKLVAKLDKQFEFMPDVHMNAARALVDVVVKCPPSTRSKLVSGLQTTPMLRQIFAHMFSGSQSSLTHSMSIIIVLVQRYANRRAELPDEHIGEGDSAVSDDPSALADEVVDEPFLSLLPHLPNIISLLSNPSELVSTPVATQFGKAIPFGETRMKVVELCLVLLRSRVRVVNACLIHLRVLPLLVDCMFAFPWNNMLHGLIESIIRTVLDSADNDADTLKHALFDEGSLVDKFIQAYASNEDAMTSIQREQDLTGGPSGAFRPGYMGHLIRTALAIEEICSKHEKIRSELLGEAAGRWSSFMSDKIEGENEKQRSSANFGGGGEESDLLDSIQFEGSGGAGDTSNSLHDSSAESALTAALAAGGLAKEEGYGTGSSFHDDDDDDENHHSHHDNDAGYDFSNEHGAGSGGSSILALSAHGEDDHHSGNDAEFESWKDTEVGGQYNEWADFNTAFGAQPASSSSTGAAAPHDDDDTNGAAGSSASSTATAATASADDDFEAHFPPAS